MDQSARFLDFLLWILGPGYSARGARTLNTKIFAPLIESASPLIETSENSFDSRATTSPPPRLSCWSFHHRPRYFHGAAEKDLQEGGGKVDEDRTLISVIY